LTLFDAEESTTAAIGLPESGRFCVLVSLTEVAFVRIIVASN